MQHRSATIRIETVKLKEIKNMLTSTTVIPTLPVVDLHRAHEFYEGKLGLKIARVDPPPAAGILFQDGEGTGLYIYQRDGATKADHTTAAFNVDDVDAQVKELKAKGVVFQELDMPGIKTVDGVATIGAIKAAWFTDTEGNILAVTNM